MKFHPLKHIRVFFQNLIKVFKLLNTVRRSVIAESQVFKVC